MNKHMDPTRLSSLFMDFYTYCVGCSLTDKYLGISFSAFRSSVRRTNFCFLHNFTNLCPILIHSCSEISAMNKEPHQILSVCCRESGPFSGSQHREAAGWKLENYKSINKVFVLMKSHRNTEGRENPKATDAGSKLPVLFAPRRWSCSWFWL